MSRCASMQVPQRPTMSSLTEYECGRAQLAIEWVARSEKPIVEIGGRPIAGCDVHCLAHDLDQCIASSGESVRAFIMPDRMPGYCCYGFYRHPWAMSAMLETWGAGHWPADPARWIWLQGLLFGYSADAIQRFMSSASCVRASNSRPIQRSESYRLRRVEIYGIPARRVRRYSNQNGKCRKLH
jgi:hypothetical protein